MEDFARSMTNEELLEVVQSMDRVSKPPSQRMEGDDDAIVNLMIRLNLNQTLVDKLLIQGEVLRECAHRGLQIPRPNSPAPASEREDYSGPKI